MQSWFREAIFTENGILNVGYAYPNLNMAENYNAAGSPYWAFKAFLLLAVDRQHSFGKPTNSYHAYHANESPLKKCEP